MGRLYLAELYLLRLAQVCLESVNESEIRKPFHSEESNYMCPNGETLRKVKMNYLSVLNYDDNQFAC